MAQLISGGERLESAEHMAARLRQRIQASLHAGELEPGDRLPSIRELATATGLTAYAVLSAYRELAQEGLVEKRERSGVYVADPARPARVPEIETARWLTSVLAGACAHRIKIPLLPELIRDWTSGTELRCLCVESVRDSAVALTAELEAQYGVQAMYLAVSELEEASLAARSARLPQPLLEADLLVTTSYHAARLQPLADALQKPMLVATAAPERVAALREHVQREGELVVVCCDPEEGERVRELVAPRERERVRTVLAGDRAALEALASDRALYVTYAAHREIGTSVSLRLLAPPVPAFSARFSRSLSDALVSLNLQRRRGARTPQLPRAG